MSIIRITESMKAPPRFVNVLDRTVKCRYRITIKKCKTWFHTYADYEVEITDLKTNQLVYQNSSNDVNNGINRATQYFSELSTLKSVKEHITNPFNKY